MPTPDKTIDVSKLVSEADVLLQTARDMDIKHVTLTALMLEDFRDALESVAEENVELKEQRGKEANSYLELINRVAHLEFDNGDLTGQLAAVAKERDELKRRFASMEQTWTTADGKDISFAGTLNELAAVAKERDAAVEALSEIGRGYIPDDKGGAIPDDDDENCLSCWMRERALVVLEKLNAK